ATVPRLPRSLAAGLADPQAEGNETGPGRVAAGGPGGGVERPPGKPTTAIAISMAANSLAHQEKELDATAAQDDGQGDSGSCGADRDCGGAAGGSHVYRSGASASGCRAAEGDRGEGLGRCASQSGHSPGASPRGPDEGLSPMDRSTAEGRI